MSDDLPEPDTPVMTVNTPIGISTSMFFKLLTDALWIVSIFFLSMGRLLMGTGMNFLPDRYWPVMDSGVLMMSSMLPCATTSPPNVPAPGPMSIRWSAALIVSSSCSTTTIELPRSLSLKSVLMSLSLSLW